jgi:phage terminase large subunit-like protein
MSRTPKPFTLPHFRAWTRELTLDTGQAWVLEPFQAAFVRDVFAGRAQNWLVVPEGNAKTTLAAGLALYHCEYREHPSVAIAASSREQAEILYRQAEGFVLRSPHLHERVHSELQQIKGKRKTEVPRFTCLEGYRRINHVGGGRIQILSADDRTGDGIIPTLCIVDELHRHRDMRLYRTWAGKLDKRNGQLVAISTAGEPGSEFEQARERIRQDAAASLRRRGCFVRAETPSLVLHEWALPEEADVEDIRAVKRANPLRAITPAMLRTKLEAPTTTMAHWRRFACNLPTRSDEAAITEAEWEAARTSETIPAGEPVWVGLDVAWKWDTTAIVPLWMRDPEHRLLGPAIVLTPPRDGGSLDHHRIERALTELHARNPIHTVVMDPSRAQQLASWIEETFGATVIARGQSAALAVVDYERFMEALRSGWLEHAGDAALTRHAMNAIARVDRFGAARFERASPTRGGGPLRERRVIDALIAAAMIHAQASIQPVVEPEPLVLFR